MSCQLHRPTMEARAPPQRRVRQWKQRQWRNGLHALVKKKAPAWAAGGAHPELQSPRTPDALRLEREEHGQQAGEGRHGQQQRRALRPLPPLQPRQHAQAGLQVVAAGRMDVFV